MGSARVCLSKQQAAPGAGELTPGHYGPGAGHRSTATQPLCGAGECRTCGPKPLRFMCWLLAEHPYPHPLHAGAEPGPRQSLHFSRETKCRREFPHLSRCAALRRTSSPASGRGWAVPCAFSSPACGRRWRASARRMRDCVRALPPFDGFTHSGEKRWHGQA